MRPIKSDAEVWLDEFSKNNNKVVNFIQVGASDGLRWDPIRRFVLRDNWSGVFIEPLYPVYQLLKANYSYIEKKNLFFENKAISNTDGEFIEFWSYSEAFLNTLPLEEKNVLFTEVLN